jgi:hypothetical protein
MTNAAHLEAVGAYLSALMRRGLPLRREDFVEFLGSIGEGTRGFGRQRGPYAGSAIDIDGGFELQHGAVVVAPLADVAENRGPPSTLPALARYLNVISRPRCGYTRWGLSNTVSGCDKARSAAWLWVLRQSCQPLRAVIHIRRLQCWRAMPSATA